MQRLMSDDGGRSFCIGTTLHFIDGQNATTESQHWKIYQLSILGTESVSFINWLQKAMVSASHRILFIT